MNFLNALHMSAIFTRKVLKNYVEFVPGQMIAFGRMTVMNSCWRWTVSAGARAGVRKATSRCLATSRTNAALLQWPATHSSNCCFGTSWVDANAFPPWQRNIHTTWHLLAYNLYLVGILAHLTLPYESSHNSFSWCTVDCKTNVPWCTTVLF